MRRALAIASLVVLGCGSTSDNGGGPAPPDASAADVAPDVGGDAPAAPDAGDGGIGYPAAHSPMPQAQTQNGPVMTAPKIVAITFAGDSLIPSVSDFIAKTLAATDYWSGATAEYGVGPIASAETLTVGDTPAANLADSDIQAYLASKLGGYADAGAGADSGPDSGADAGVGVEGGADAGPVLPPPDINTQYVLFYPPGVNVTFGGGQSCTQSGFMGYHNQFVLGAGFVTYVVVPRCSPQMQGVSQIDLVAAIASHELIEAATDPLVNEHPAWDLVDQDHLAWSLLGGSEIGDLCDAFPDSFYKPADLPYLVQRVWSNKAAAASHDPCEPDGSSPYFNSAPVLTDTIAGSVPQLGAFTTKGVKIPVGQSKTVELDLYSDQPTSGPWTVQAIDIDSAFFGGPTELSFAFDKTQGQNGDKIQMTITVVSAPSGQLEPFWIQSQLGNTQTIWLGLVGN